jgi:hypothetical protein
LEYIVITEDGEVLVQTNYPDVANICAWGIAYQKEIPVMTKKGPLVIRHYKPIIRSKSWVEVSFPTSTTRPQEGAI